MTASRIKRNLFIYICISLLLAGCGEPSEKEAPKIANGYSDETMAEQTAEEPEEEKLRIICEQVAQMDFAVNEPVMNVTKEEDRRYREAYLKVLQNEIPVYEDGTHYCDLWKAGIEFETLLEHRDEREFLYCYYYDDLDGDGKPEFAIDQGCMYLFDYDMEKAECRVSYSQESCYFKKILGAGQIWEHDGLHGGVIRDDLYLLNGQNEWVQVLTLEEGAIPESPFYRIEIATPNISADVGKENWDIVTAPFWEMSKGGLPLKTLEEVFGDLLEADSGLMDREGYLYVDNGDGELWQRFTLPDWSYEYEEIPYADEETFHTILDAYEQIDYLGESIPVSEADYAEALGNFARLMRNEIPFIDADTGEKRYVKDLKDYESSYKDNWRYYLWDIDGDGILEACINSWYTHFLDGQEYIFQYCSDTDQYYRRKTFYRKGAVTVQGIHIENGGSFFCPGYDSSILEFTRINPDSEPILRSLFFAVRVPVYTSEYREYLYMAMIPWYAAPEKEIQVTGEMKRQGIYEKKSGQWYFRITEEQFEELAEPYEAAWETARNKLKEEWMTYEELLGNR